MRKVEGFKGGWGGKVVENEVSTSKNNENILDKFESLKLPADNQSVKSDESEDFISAAEKSLLSKLGRSKLVPNTNEIEVQRSNPLSPLYSCKSFAELNLHKDLLKGVYEMGFNAPSKIQETALPILLADPPSNLIAQSQSGTGKTAAFVLAMLSRINPDLKYPQVLCLSPTYELAVQTGEVAARMGRYRTGISLRYVVRGEELERGSKVTDNIIIGTPGKVLDWGTKYRFFDLSKIKLFVLDEADVMIATQGHQDQSFRIRRHIPSDCQIVFFSATYDDEVMGFARGIVTNPIVIRLKREEESLDNIKQFYTLCNDKDDKFNAISNLYGIITIGQMIIFCQTRRTASWLTEKMTKEGHAVALLSGELTVEQRINVLDRFREGKEKVLITTNVLSRGIDIEQVTIVVNFDMPLDQTKKPDCETYLHRIGRTGRFGKTGLAINLVSLDEYNAVVIPIEEHFGKSIENLNTDDFDDLEKLNGK